MEDPSFYRGEDQSPESQGQGWTWLVPESEDASACLVHISAGWVRDEAHEKWTLPEGYSLGLGTKGQLVGGLPGR